jgi:hypothetical protein
MRQARLIIKDGDDHVWGEKTVPFKHGNAFQTFIILLDGTSVGLIFEPLQGQDLLTDTVPMYLAHIVVDTRGL